MTIFKALKIQAEIVILQEIQELQESVPRLILYAEGGDTGHVAPSIIQGRQIWTDGRMVGDPISPFCNRFATKKILLTRYQLYRVFRYGSTGSVQREGMTT